MAIKVKILPSIFLNKDMKLPALGSSNAGGYDVRANIDKPMKIEPNMTAKVPLGFRIQPEDSDIHAILIARSGKGHKGLVMSNQIGLIDNDYQGEVCALLYNRNNVQSMVIEPGEAIAQLAFVELPKAEFEIVEAFDEETERGEDGFGSTDEVKAEVVPVEENFKPAEEEIEEYTENGVALSSIEFTTEALSAMEMPALRDIGDFFGVKDNKKSDLVAKILAANEADLADTE